MDASNIHEDFPMLGEDSALVYLDTAATSLTPRPVLKAVRKYFTEYRASTHRGLYAEAERATIEYESARAKVAKFIGADTNEIIFTSGATASSNMLTYALEQSHKCMEGDEIVTTVMEHHAALLPLQELAKRKGLILKTAQLDSGCILDYTDIEGLITDRTRVVSVLLASNVLGTINDVARIAKKAHEVGAVCIVDATAAVGHMSVDVKDLGIDYLFFSGHKMCGPTGIGVLYGKKEELKQLKPSIFGGGMVSNIAGEKIIWSEVPQRFEAGTPHIAGAIGLGVAVEYVESVGIENIRTHCIELVRYAEEKLISVDGITLYASASEENIGSISFTLDGVHPHDIAQVCADRRIAIRAGHHCALPLHGALNVPATARASVYLYNTRDDVDALVEAVRATKSIFT